MTKRLISKTAVALLLFILLCTFYSCKPGFLVTPSENKNIYAEVSGTSIHYYCYFKFLNTSSLTCNVSVEKALQHLKLISPLPLTLAPNKSTDVKFEIIDFNPVSPCPTPAPCLIEEVPLKGVWPQYSDNSYFMEQKADVQWSAPVEQINCWVPTDPPGGQDEYYTAPLCVYMAPHIGGGGTSYKWPKITEVYNPNNFLIKVLVNDPSKETYHCYSTGLPAGQTRDTYFTWVDLPPGTSFNYGQTIKNNYSAACLAANPDAGIYIWSPGHSYTLINDNTKWIAIRVTLAP